jgi:hypothetical protein
MKHKKIIIAALVAVSAAGMCMARPGHGHHRGGHHHHHHHSAWGRGGRNFWPGFLGGVAAGIVADSIINRPAVVTTTPVVVTPAPVVVTQPAPVVVTPPAPVYQTQNVWVEGQYVDQVQANGAVVRTWVPGHYEQRTVQVQ